MSNGCKRLFTAMNQGRRVPRDSGRAVGNMEACPDGSSRCVQGASPARIRCAPPYHPNGRQTIPRFEQERLHSCRKSSKRVQGGEPRTRLDNEALNGAAWHYPAMDSNFARIRTTKAVSAAGVPGGRGQQIQGVSRRRVAQRLLPRAPLRFRLKARQAAEHDS